jgi:prolyl-tRNA synthetase
VDDRDQHRPGYKFSEWELKGVPIRIEIGPKDVDADRVVLAYRFDGTKEEVPTSDVVSGMAARLEQTQRSLFDDATAFRDANMHQGDSYETFREGIAAEGGFWVGAWCGEDGCENKVNRDTSATIRLLPLEREDPGAPCLVCGSPGTERAIWAKAY